jgi:hypothetical protein
MNLHLPIPRKRVHPVGQPCFVLTQYLRIRLGFGSQLREWMGKDQVSDLESLLCKSLDITPPVTLSP